MTFFQNYVNFCESIEQSCLKYIFHTYKHKETNIKLLDKNSLTQICANILLNSHIYEFPRMLSYSDKVSLIKQRGASRTIRRFFRACMHDCSCTFMFTQNGKYFVLYTSPSIRFRVSRSFCYIPRWLGVMADFFCDIWLPIMLLIPGVVVLGLSLIAWPHQTTDTAAHQTTKKNH